MKRQVITRQAVKKRAWYSAALSVVVIAMLVTGLGIATGGCNDSAAATTNPLKLGESDNGKSFTMKTGETIEISIAGNPTTGYAWTPALDEGGVTLLEQVGEPVYTPDQTESDVVGSGGVYTFTFKAVAGGEAAVKLVYSRAWESVEPLETYEVTVTIE